MTDVRPHDEYCTIPFLPFHFVHFILMRPFAFANKYYELFLNVMQCDANPMFDTESISSQLF